MNRHPKRAKREERTIQAWTHEQAKEAAGYIASILRSLRERWLESMDQKVQVKRLEKQPGRPNTAAIIALEECRREARLAHDALSRNTPGTGRPGRLLPRSAERPGPGAVRPR